MPAARAVAKALHLMAAMAPSRQIDFAPALVAAAPIPAAPGPFHVRLHSPLLACRVLPLPAQKDRALVGTLAGPLIDSVSLHRRVQTAVMLPNRDQAPELPVVVAAGSSDPPAAGTVATAGTAAPDPVASLLIAPVAGSDLLLAGDPADLGLTLVRPLPWLVNHPDLPPSFD